MILSNFLSILRHNVSIPVSEINDVVSCYTVFLHNRIPPAGIALAHQGEAHLLGGLPSQA